ncbi:MAG: hypothetical protein LBG71_00825 [Clostridiales Family XIII bacterium]|jgi:phosphoglycerate dehydrogenase-like enzyme|nr:hypothetical protein [Clostridiales Family XIII bacterium]
MYNLLKPYGDDKERAALDGLVRFMTLEETERERRERELNDKLRVCDILQADVDITVDDAMLRKAPNLKAIFCTSIGVDYVDVEAAAARGVIVANNPDFCVRAVAEFAIGLIYALLRRIPEGAEAVKAEDWAMRDVLRGVQLHGKTLGIVGFGKIARDVVRQALGVGMSVLVRVRGTGGEGKEKIIREAGAEPVSFQELLRRSDILSLHTPLTDETRLLIGREELAAMKEKAYLINVSRGGVVDEQALADSLRAGKLAGAATDVLASEPPERCGPLTAYAGKNLIITPHIAWYTEEAERECFDYYIRQVTDFVAGRIPEGILNKPASHYWASGSV